MSIIKKPLSARRRNGIQTIYVILGIFAFLMMVIILVALTGNDTLTARPPRNTTVTDSPTLLFDTPSDRSSFSGLITATTPEMITLESSIIRSHRLENLMVKVVLPPEIPIWRRGPIPQPDTNGQIGPRPRTAGETGDLTVGKTVMVFPTEPYSGQDRVSAKEIEVDYPAASAAGSTPSE